MPFTCSNCQHEIHAKPIETYDGYVCSECYSTHYKTCPECKEVWHTDTFVRMVEGLICEGCRDDHYKKCDNCGEFYHEEDVSYADNGTFCNFCLSGNLTRREKEEGRGDRKYHQSKE